MEPMRRHPLSSLLGPLLVVLFLTSCASVYQHPGDRSLVPYGTSAVRLGTSFAPEQFFRKLGRNLPGAQEASPSPEDLVVVEHFVATNDMASVENLLAAMERHHVAVFRGMAQSDGQEWPLFVRADVFDRSGKVWDPKTNQEVPLPAFTNTDFAFLRAQSDDAVVFQRPGPVDAEAAFPLRLLETKEWGVYLTTVRTNLDSPGDRATALHGLWPTFKLPEQQFEIRDAQGRVVAWFDNRVLAVTDDPQLDKKAVKSLAAAVLALQMLVRAYHLDDSVSVRFVSPAPPPPQEFPIVFPPKPSP